MGCQVEQKPTGSGCRGSNLFTELTLDSLWQVLTCARTNCCTPAAACFQEHLNDNNNNDFANLIQPDLMHSALSGGQPYDIQSGVAVGRMKRNIRYHANRYCADCIAGARVELEAVAMGDAGILEYLNRYVWLVFPGCHVMPRSSQ